MLMGPILNTAARDCVQICQRGLVFQLLVTSVVIGIVTWNLALSGSRESWITAGPQPPSRVFCTGCGLCASVRRLGHRPSCPEGRLGGTWAQSQILALALALPLSSRLNPYDQVVSLPLFFNSSGREGAHSAYLLRVL
ncbi:hypothetical protein HJG60_010967 [Phyllostomus discolor]|uniref:Uncharacterized protein n=1 Tax=Phyllostomus discolor TaxID=89673 RepID=A0A834ACA5_9CHIR|nr:hypothetical protein HJG60_010967 [Phyllostomus discolor]